MLLIITVGVLARQTWASWPASTPGAIASSPPASASCHAVSYRWYHCYVEPSLWALIARWRGYDLPQPSGSGANPMIAEDATPREPAPLSKDAKLVAKATAQEIARAAELADRDHGKHSAELAYWIRKVRKKEENKRGAGEPPSGKPPRSAAARAVRLTRPPGPAPAPRPHAPAPAPQHAIAGAVPGQKRPMAPRPTRPPRPSPRPVTHPTPSPSPRVPRPSTKDSQLIAQASALEIKQASELAALDNGTHPAELAYWIMKVRGGTVRRSLV